MKEGTLADHLIREWSSRVYRSRIDRHGWIPRNTALARKFVLDTEMSAFVADLSYSVFPATSSSARIKAIVESTRASSRLPFPTTWIELDMKARTERSKQYGVYSTGFRGPERIGWLMMRHPQNEHAFMACHCGSHSIDPSRRDDDALLPIPNAGTYCYVWVTDDSPLPWPTISIEPFGKDLIAQWLVGHLEYTPFGHRLGLMHSPYATKEFRAIVSTPQAINDVLREQAGDVRCLWAFLAALNDIPVLKTVIRPQHGHMTGGQYRRFVEHTVISLVMPTKITYRGLAQKVARAARRRAHPVRGHWRKDWRIMPAALCDHLWMDESDHNVCTLCKGRRYWITEHQRGDASLGFVLHDYAVKRGEA